MGASAWTQRLPVDVLSLCIFLRFRPAFMDDFSNVLLLFKQLEFLGICRCDHLFLELSHRVLERAYKIVVLLRIDLELESLGDSWKRDWTEDTFRIVFLVKVFNTGFEVIACECPISLVGLLDQYSIVPSLTSR